MFPPSSCLMAMSMFLMVDGCFTLQLVDRRTRMLSRARGHLPGPGIQGSELQRDGGGGDEGLQYYSTLRLESISVFYIQLTIYFCHISHNRIHSSSCPLSSNKPKLCFQVRVRILSINAAIMSAYRTTHHSLFWMLGEYSKMKMRF